jgi:hypothetical protein
MKKLIFTLFLLNIFFGLSAEEDTLVVRPWKFEGFFSQQLNQSSFTNWAAGGENSLASTTIFNVQANYQEGLRTWENRLSLAYGMVKTEGLSTRKNEDKIEFLSRYGRKVGDQIKVSTQLNFRSQFAEGFNYPNDSVVVSRFMAPGYLTLALGLDYRPVEYFSIFLSPATGKFTFVLDDELSEQGAFGVEPGETVRPEFGALMTLLFDKEIFENTKVTSKLDLFNNYTDSDPTRRRNIDVNWETSINLKVNRYITASILAHLIYDPDIMFPIVETIAGEQVQVGEETRTQFKQVLGIGLSYSF